MFLWFRLQEESDDEISMIRFPAWFSSLHKKVRYHTDKPRTSEAQKDFQLHVWSLFQYFPGTPPKKKDHPRILPRNSMLDFLGNLVILLVWLSQIWSPKTETKGAPVTSPLPPCEVRVCIRLTWITPPDHPVLGGSSQWLGYVVNNHG